MLKKLFGFLIIALVVSTNLFGQEFVNLIILINPNGKYIYSEPNKNSSKIIHVRGHEALFCISNPSIENTNNSLYNWRPVYIGDTYGYMELSKKDISVPADNDYFMNLRPDTIQALCKKMAYTKYDKENQENILVYEDEKGTKVLKSLEANVPIIILEADKYEAIIKKKGKNSCNTLIKVRFANNIGYIYDNALDYAMLKNKNKGLCAQCLESINNIEKN